MPKLSFFLAGIRTNNWDQLYNSAIAACGNEDFEIVFVGPTEPNKNLKNKPNIKFIQDYGCPSRCYQLGLINCSSEYVLWIADDGYLIPNSVNNAFKLIDSLPSNTKNVVSMRYVEGDPDLFLKKHKKGLDIRKNNYWQIDSHKFLRKQKFVPSGLTLVMNALISKAYLTDLGGFDCRFEHIGLGAPDLAIRMQRDGAKVSLGDYFMKLTHFPESTGDHGPIAVSHRENDCPLFHKIYNDPSALTRIRIDINNWQNVPAKWSRRFT